MLGQARGLGARCLACDTMLRISGVPTDEAEQVLDEVLGLPALWRLTEGARLVSF